MSGAEPVDVAVVGAGVAGLAAAKVLRDAGRSVRVLDAGSQLGGVVQSERKAGYRVEHGPNTLRVTGAVRQVLVDLGVADLLVPAAPANRLRFLFHEGRLVPFPMGLLDAARTPLVTTRGKLRILAEPFVRRGDASGETVAAFIARRLGSEAVDRLVAPFLTGVYAGDERQLGAEPVFPSLVEAERRRGSIALGLATAPRKAPGALPALPGIHSCPDGLAALALRLGSDLGETVALGTRVASLARDGGALRLEAGSGGGLAARHVILATPASATARLVRDLEPEAAEAVSGIAYAPIVVSHVGIDPAASRHPIEGFGFLVPRAARLGLLGCLFLSNLFPGRAPEGRALLTCMLGGVRWPEAVEQGNDALAERLRRDLEATLGLRDEPEWIQTLRWREAVPQPGPDHPHRVGEVRRRLAPHRIEVAGAWVAGVSLGDSLASGVAAARRILASDGAGR